jgi:hypothetical protein
MAAIINSNNNNNNMEMMIEYFRKFNRRNEDNSAIIYKFDLITESIIQLNDNEQQQQQRQRGGGGGGGGGEGEGEEVKRGMITEWEQFINSKLTEDNECKYVLYKFRYMSATDKIERSKLIFILWSPSSAPRKQKMMSAFFAHSFLDRIGATSAVSCQIQASSLDSLDYHDVLEKLSRTLSVK